jgi:hypothetical protein
MPMHTKGELVMPRAVVRIHRCDVPGVHTIEKYAETYGWTTAPPSRPTIEAASVVLAPRSVRIAPYW